MSDNADLERCRQWESECVRLRKLLEAVYRAGEGSLYVESKLTPDGSSFKVETLITAPGMNEENVGLSVAAALGDIFFGDDAKIFHLCKSQMPANQQVEQAT